MPLVWWLWWHSEWQGPHGQTNFGEVVIVTWAMGILLRQHEDLEPDGHLFINGCFNWMIPDLYLGNGWKS